MVWTKEPGLHQREYLHTLHTARSPDAEKKRKAKQRTNYIYSSVKDGLRVRIREWGKTGPQRWAE
jgi:hypothetical protein